MKSTILLIGDDPVDLKALQRLLLSWDHDVLVARSGADGLAALATAPVDLVVSDLRMPGMGGDAVVSAVAASHPGLPVLLVTGHGDIPSAVQAMKQGAFDYILKPPPEDEFRLAIARALEHSRLRRDNACLLADLRAGGAYAAPLICRSAAMAAVVDLIDRVAATDSTVLITGETGTGKELVARTLHYRSRRAGRPLVALNCAALNPNLVESELFGHEKGAFTGAVAARRGRFEEADGGTLFLDEISEIPPELQAKLLRALQEGEVERMGSSRHLRTDVRILASTNRQIEAEVRAGRFREDLFYRLNVIPIRLPPLRERREDVPLLAAHFASHFGQRYRSAAATLSAETGAFLSRQDWRGNVRELQHAVERAAVLSSHGRLEPADFVFDETAPAAAPAGETLEAVLEARTREHLLATLNRAHWHKQNAANLLGIDRVTLYRLIRKHGIDTPGTVLE